MPDRIDKFTARARKALQLAQEEAEAYEHKLIGTEHILLGLLDQRDCVAAGVLQQLGLESEQVRQAVELVAEPDDLGIPGERDLTPRAKRAIELGVEEANRMRHTHVGTEHLLLGLIREGGGIAATVLESLGVDLDVARAQVIAMLNQPRGGAPTGAEPSPN